ncbi:hypothetical protein L9F63_021185, partial [Diploptera punctata]
MDFFSGQLFNYTSVFHMTSCNLKTRSTVARKTITNIPSRKSPEDRFILHISP